MSGGDVTPFPSSFRHRADETINEPARLTSTDRIAGRLEANRVKSVVLLERLRAKYNGTATPPIIQRLGDKYRSGSILWPVAWMVYAMFFMRYCR